jgi:hypothetical protein
MAWEHREGSGSLFKNDQKGNEKAPGYRGEILLGGVLYELAGWLKEGKNGKFFSISGKPKENVNHSQGYKSQVGDEKEEIDDSGIPF